MGILDPDPIVVIKRGRKKYNLRKILQEAAVPMKHRKFHANRFLNEVELYLYKMYWELEKYLPPKERVHTNKLMGRNPDPGLSLSFFKILTAIGSMVGKK